MANGWTAERRAKQAQLIRQYRLGRKLQPVNQKRRVMRAV